MIDEYKLSNDMLTEDIYVCLPPHSIDLSRSSHNCPAHIAPELLAHLRRASSCANNITVTTSGRTETARPHHRARERISARWTTKVKHRNQGKTRLRYKHKRGQCCKVFWLGNTSDTSLTIKIVYYNTASDIWRRISDQTTNQHAQQAGSRETAIAISGTSIHQRTSGSDLNEAHL